MERCLSWDLACLSSPPVYCVLRVPNWTREPEQTSHYSPSAYHSYFVLRRSRCGTWIRRSWLMGLRGIPERKHANRGTEGQKRFLPHSFWFISHIHFLFGAVRFIEPINCHQVTMGTTNVQRFRCFTFHWNFYHYYIAIILYYIIVHLKSNSNLYLLSRVHDYTRISFSRPVKTKKMDSSEFRAGDVNLTEVLCGLRNFLQGNVATLSSKWPRRLLSIPVPVNDLRPIILLSVDFKKPRR